MATALELTREGWGRYLEAASRRRAPEMTAGQKEERRHLLERVREAAMALKQGYGVTRVVLFGSLARTTGGASVSDVDLAVSGLAGPQYWEAWGLVEEIIGYKPVDLIELENAPPSLRRAIEQQGIEL